jgi:hypothetical protein
VVAAGFHMKELNMKNPTLDATYSAPHSDSEPSRADQSHSFARRAIRTAARAVPYVAAAGIGAAASVLVRRR